MIYNLLVRRRRTLLFALALSGCEAQAASEAARGEDRVEAELASEAEAESDADVDLNMEAERVVDRPLAPARVDEAAAPSWRMPEHDPGELPRWITHEGIPRDSLAELAVRYGVRPEKIREWNEIPAGEDLHPRRPGQLRIYATRYPPPRVRVEHEVVEGEQGWLTISRLYAVDSMHLRAWNVARTGRSLEPGETLEVWVDPTIYAGIVNDLPANKRAAMVRPGAHGLGTPQDGELVAGVQIPPGPGYELRYPNGAWGTTWAVRQLIAALDDFNARSDYPHPIKIGTMSRQRGGKVGGHVSHQTGRDVDVRLPMRAAVPQGLKPTPRRVDWTVTWQLIQAFARTSIVQVIFLDYKVQRRLYRAAKAAGASEEELDALLQYPRGKRANLGLVRHSPGHRGHIHVRFPCGPHESLCAD